MIRVLGSACPAWQMGELERNEERDEEKTLKDAALFAAYLSADPASL